MAKSKIGKEIAVKSILSDLKKGIDKKTLLQKTAKICKVSDATARRYYDVAKEQFDIFKAKAEPIIEAKEIEALGEIAKAGILSKIERQKILSEIAQGEIEYAKEVATKMGIVSIIDKPSFADRRAAIAELNKMDGEYAPIKTDLTSKGDKIESNAIQIEIIKPSDFED